MKLNFNESLFVDRARQTELVKELADELDLRLYPEDEVPKFLEKLTRYIGVPENFLVVGNGRDELIDRIGKVLCGEGRSHTFFCTNVQHSKAMC